MRSQEWGSIYIGCAGGGDAKLAIPLERDAAPQDAEAGARAEPPAARWHLRVEGLLGGHSGICIGEGRANAVQLAARAVQDVLSARPDVKLVAIDGGDKHNAIPREASALLVVPAGAEAAVRQAVADARSAFVAEYGLLESKGSIDLRPLPATEGDWRQSAQPLTTECAERCLAVLVALPHGSLKQSHALPGLVETSNNLAAVTTDAPAGGAGGQAPCMRVLCSSRSSVWPAIEGVRAKLRAIATVMGKGSIELSPAYPGWQPNPSSRVLELTKAALAAQLRAEGIADPPHVLAIHAGLECGLIGEKCALAATGGAELDMVSFGPTIRGAHSPDEAVEIETVPKFYALTKEVLRQLAQAKA